MRWVYVRGGASLGLETRLDHQRQEYLAILTHADGHQDTNGFATARALRHWLVWMDSRLISERWLQEGPPHLLSDDGPALG